jgi:hypothetical protein
MRNPHESKINAFGISTEERFKQALLGAFWSILLLPSDDEFVDEGFRVFLGLRARCKTIHRFVALLPSLVYAPSKAGDAIGIG